MTPQTYQSPQSTTKIRPTKTGIWVGVMLMVVAFIAFVGLMAGGLVSLFSDFSDYAQVEAGSTEALELDSGTYLVFIEQGAYAGVTVVGDSGPLDLRLPTANSTYSADEAQFGSAFAFDAPSAGTYQVTNEGPGLIAVGPPFAGKLVGVLLVPFLVGLLVGGAGLALLITTLVRRRNARRRLVQPQQYA